jgi:hypothetical protein
MQTMTQRFRRGFILPAAAMCALSVPIGTVQAALVNFNYAFTGSLNPNLDPLAMIPVTGTFQLTDGMGSGGAYNGAVTGFTLSFGSLYSATFASGANAVTISQNVPMVGGNGDRWALVSAATGPDLNGFTPFRFDLRLDGPETLLTNNDLQDPPSFSSLSGSNLTAARWRLFFEDADGNPAAYLGSITSLTAVPLPAAVLLFGAGLISLVGLGAGGLRNLRGSRA